MRYVARGNRCPAFVAEASRLAEPVLRKKQEAIARFNATLAGLKRGGQEPASNEPFCKGHLSGQWSYSFRLYGEEKCDKVKDLIEQLDDDAGDILDDGSDAQDNARAHLEAHFERVDSASFAYDDYVKARETMERLGISIDETEGAIDHRIGKNSDSSFVRRATTVGQLAKEYEGAVQYLSELDGYLGKVTAASFRAQAEQTTQAEPNEPKVVRFIRLADNIRKLAQTVEEKYEAALRPLQSKNVSSEDAAKAVDYLLRDAADKSLQQKIATADGLAARMNTLNDQFEPLEQRIGRQAIDEAMKRAKDVIIGDKTLKGVPAIILGMCFDEAIIRIGAEYPTVTSAELQDTAPSR